MAGQNILSSVIPIFLYVLSICIYTFRVYSRNWPMRVKWALFGNFGGAFFKKGGSTKDIWTYWYRLFHEKTNTYWLFTTILEHSGQMKKPRLKWLQNPECLSGEIMTQTKKRKAIETVRGYKSSKKVYRAAAKSVMWLCQWFFFQKKNTYPWAYNFCAPFDVAM